MGKSGKAGAVSRPSKSGKLKERPFEPEHSLPHAFSFVANRVSRILQQMYVERYGLSVTGWRLIAILSNHSPLSAKALAELTAMDQVSVSRAIEQLVVGKFVSRRVDAKDRRRVVLRLSSKGEQTFNEILPLFRTLDATITSALSEEQSRQLRDIMEQVMAHTAVALSDDCEWQSFMKKDKADTHRLVTASRPAARGNSPTKKRFSQKS